MKNLENNQTHLVDIEPSTNLHLLKLICCPEVAPYSINIYLPKGLYVIFCGSTISFHLPKSTKDVILLLKTSSTKQNKRGGKTKEEIKHFLIAPHTDKKSIR